VETSSDVSSETIRTQLDRILTSPGFVHSDRMARFLRFAVEQTIQGRADSLKETILGMEVFDRTTSFDPRTDTIVRVEARRLRSKLKEYYETHGQYDAVLIEFPKGSYVPTFLLANGRGEAPQASLSPRSASTQPVRVASLIQWHLGITIAAGLLLVAVSVGITWWYTRLSPPAQSSKLTRLTSDLGLTYQPALSSDGKLVAYASDRSGEGNLDIWVKQVTGGEPVRLTRHEADDSEPNFSPDGSKIAFRSERDGGGVYIIPSLGGEERLIVPECRQPKFSPDGAQLACWSGMPGHVGYSGTAGRVYVVTLAEGLSRELHPKFDVARHPIWSPDGKHLMVVGFRNKEEETGRGPAAKSSPQDLLDWWIVALDTGIAAKTGAFGALRQNGLSHGWYYWQPGSWIANDKGQTAVFSAGAGDANNIWSVGLSPKTWQLKGAPQRLTSGTDWESDPSFGSTKLFAFSSLTVNYDIWCLPIQANTGKPLTKPYPLTRDAADDIHPSLSSDGTKLAFNSNRLGQPDIWMKDLVTSKEAPVTEGPRNEGRVLISPDGSKLVYTVTENGQTDFYLGSSSGRPAVKVCENCGGNLLGWSPEGNEVLYWSGRPVHFSLLNITTGDKTIVLQHPKYDLYRGQISPDGRWIAFHVPIESDRLSASVYVAPLRKDLPPDEKDWILVATGAGHPCWSPDGNLLYFLSTKDGFLCLWAQALSPKTKTPAGMLIDVQHAHSPRWSMGKLSMGNTRGLSVARDKIVFSTAETMGNVWLAEMER
jgi:eukaryotic-like serine/threonine-protein kinase